MVYIIGRNRVFKEVSMLICINHSVTWNPCRCGYYPDKNRCTCSEKEISNYRNKLSGPLLDRIDMYVETARVDLDKLQSTGKGESSESIRKKVERARRIQEKRFQNREYSFNAEMPSSDIEIYCSLGKEEKQLMELAYRNLQLSARTYHRVLKVARTIADLEGSEKIKKHHIAEALAYRLAERNDRKDG